MKTNDSKIYAAGALAFLAVALLLAAVSLWSVLVVEPDVRQKLSSKENVDARFREAYLALREPQLFAGYRHFDEDGIKVKNTLIHFDRKVYAGEALEEADRPYLQVLLARRTKGARLGLHSAVFALIMTFIFAAALVHERRQPA